MRASWRDTVKSEYSHVSHGFPPYIEEDSRILILGSFPSIASREAAFFYGHPRNRFWPLLAELLKEEVPATIEEKKHLLKKHHIALYDSIEECDVRASSDASLRNITPADIPSLLKKAPISVIFCNGTASYNYLLKYHPDLPAAVRKLPSTSPANAAVSFVKLQQEWAELAEIADQR